jgi:hypothetical protein
VPFPCPLPTVDFVFPHIAITHDSWRSRYSPRAPKKKIKRAKAATTHKSSTQNREVDPTLSMGPLPT